jgi:ribA/ribD-fused uncharacterized protein
MSEHVNIENDEVTVPYYAIHADGKICGFFGPFRFLSNFYMLEDGGIALDEIYYPSVEHAYQAAKWPYHLRDQFSQGITPGKAKKLGQEAPRFNKKRWDKQKVSVMTGLCNQKFWNNAKMKAMLLMTEDCHLEERNSWGDTFWGTDVNGVGENTLGKILMMIRSDIATKREMF